MADPEFQRQALEHLNALYNLAVYLTRNGPEAEDLVQETYLRAFRFSRQSDQRIFQHAIEIGASLGIEYSFWSHGRNHAIPEQRGGPGKERLPS